MRGEICHGRFCPKCDETERLEDTGETFNNRFGGYTVYKCSSCGTTYKLQSVYEIIEKQYEGENRG